MFAPWGPVGLIGSGATETNSSLGPESEDGVQF